MIILHTAAAALLGLLAVQSPIAFSSVLHSTHSQSDESREVTIRTVAEWRALWQAHAPPSTDLPRVDFDKEMVVGVFLGSRPTGGYAVDIVSVEANRGEIAVTYRESQPPRDAILTQALTSPVHLVRIPQHQGAVRFVRAKR